MATIVTIEMNYITVMKQLRNITVVFSLLLLARTSLAQETLHPSATHLKKYVEVAWLSKQDNDWLRDETATRGSVVMIMLGDTDQGDYFGPTILEVATRRYTQASRIVFQYSWLTAGGEGFWQYSYSPTRETLFTQFSDNSKSWTPNGTMLRVSKKVIQAAARDHTSFYKWEKYGAVRQIAKSKMNHGGNSPRHKFTKSRN
jgi:hypothetical protein